MGDFVLYREQTVNFADPTLRLQGISKPDYKLDDRQSYLTDYTYDTLLGYRELTDTGISELVSELYKRHNKLVRKAENRGLPVILSSGILTPFTAEIREQKPISEIKGNEFQHIELLANILYFPSVENRQYEPNRAVIEIVGQPRERKLTGNVPFFPIKNITPEDLEAYIKQAVFLGGVKALKSAIPSPLKPYSGQVFVWHQDSFDTSEEALIRYNGKLPFVPRLITN